MKANSSDSIRANHARLFLIPVVERLVTTLGQQESEHRLKHLLAALRQNHGLATGYAPGNLLNLIMYLGANLRSLDCSLLTLRHVALSGVEIPSSSFRQTVFKS